MTDRPKSPPEPAAAALRATSSSIVSAASPARSAMFSLKVSSPSMAISGKVCNALNCAASAPPALGSARGRQRSTSFGAAMASTLPLRHRTK